jgi:DnaJ-class molecular chaperone
MNGSDDSGKDKMVGYGHPPIATQFQKGRSGNPKGRPKGRKGVGMIFQDALHRKIEVREGDRVRSMPKIEAAIEVNLNKALKGDHRSFVKVMLESQLKCPRCGSRRVRVAFSVPATPIRAAAKG